MHHFLAKVAAQKEGDMQRHAAAARAARIARREAPATGLRRIARRIAASLAEFDAAQRRRSVLTMSVDYYLPEPDRAPDDYAEFLFRTSGPSLREPAADQRLAGKPVR